MARNLARRGFLRTAVEAFIEARQRQASGQHQQRRPEVPELDEEVVRDRRHADALCCGQTYLDLYALDRDQKKIAPFRAAVDRMIGPHAALT